jgi:hypothetical protein
MTHEQNFNQYLVLICIYWFSKYIGNIESWSDKLNHGKAFLNHLSNKVDSYINHLSFITVFECVA